MGSGNRVGEAGGAKHFFYTVDSDYSTQRFGNFCCPQPKVRDFFLKKSRGMG